MMKTIHTISALVAMTLGANAATYVLYDAGAGPASNPNTGAPWGTWDASTGGSNALGGPDGAGYATTTGSGAAAWAIGDEFSNDGNGNTGGRGDALYYDFLSGSPELTDMLTNGFTISIELESTGSGGFISLGDNNDLLSGGSTRYGATPGVTAGGIETLTFTWAPGDSGPSSNFGTSGSGSTGEWVVANGLRLNIADNTAGTQSWEMKIHSITVETVPEPTSTALLSLGGLTLVLRRRK